MNPEKIKWYAVTQYVDIETGEIISKSLKERKYITVKTSKQHEIKEYRNGEKIGIIKHTNECVRNRQGTIW